MPRHSESAMLTRLTNAIDAGRKAVSEDRKAAEVQNLLALLVLDELGPMAEPTRSRHLEAAASAGQRPLLVLSPDSELEQADLAYLCEFLPRGHDIAASTGQRPDNILRYRLARLRLILDKWDVRECRWIGDGAGDLVEAWSRDPALKAKSIRFFPAH